MRAKRSGVVLGFTIDELVDAAVAEFRCSRSELVDPRRGQTGIIPFVRGAMAYILRQSGMDWASISTVLGFANPGNACTAASRARIVWEKKDQQTLRLKVKALQDAMRPRATEDTGRVP